MERRGLKRTRERAKERSLEENKVKERKKRLRRGKRERERSLVPLGRERKKEIVGGNMLQSRKREEVLD